MKELLMAVAFVSFVAFPISSSACSLIPCPGKGIELRREFVVRVTHGGKSLQGVDIKVTGNTADGKTIFSGITAADGSVRVADLPPGEYWLNAELLGIVAGSECFYVDPHPTRKARKTVSYEWGDLALATRQIAGRLIDSQPGQGGTPIMNQLHRVDVPIREATLKLQNPLTGAVYNTKSDEDGHFSFGRIPTGTYVLHIDAGTTRNHRDYDPTDLLLSLSNTAKANTLVLARRDAGGGSCGGTYLEPKD